MDFKEYTNGERTIKATVTMYEMLYRNVGFKPVKENGNSDKGRSRRNDKTENPVDDDGKSTTE